MWGVSGSDSLLIMGLGPVGLAAALLGRGRGARYILGVDIEPSRVERAKNLSLVNDAICPSDEILGKIIEYTKGGADVSIDCSGNPEGRLLALRGSAEWGRVVFLGETGTVSFDVSEDLMHKQRTILGSWVTSLANMERCCRDLANWNMHPDKIIEKILPLNQADEAYRLMANGKCGKIMLNPEL